LGAAILVAAVVAPAAFAVLPSRTLAGALVGRVLPALFWSGMLVGLVVAALAARLPSPAWRVGGGLTLAAACAAAQLVIAPRIEAIRASIGGPVDALDALDPRRQAFGRLHGLSVAWMGLGALAAFVTLLLLVRSITARSTP
jgi:hypothetical protein